MARVRLLSVGLSSLGLGLVVLLGAACVRESNNGDLLQEACTRNSDCDQGLVCQVSSGVCQPSNSPQGGAGGISGASGGAMSGGAMSAGGSSNGGTSAGTSGSGAGGSSSSGGSTDGGTTASNRGGSENGGTTAAAGSSAARGGAPVTTADTIDDFEDDDGRILESNGRKGPWHIFNQGSGTQMPSGDSPFLPEQSGANGSKYAAHTSGSGYDFAGIGCDLNNADTKPESMQSQPFNASAFKGIAFYIKGKAKLRVEFPTKNFVPPERGGACSNDCWNVYGYRTTTNTWNDWQEVRVQFSQLARQDDSTKPPFDASQLMSISFKHDSSDAFDFWIDDLRFTKD